MKIALGTVSKTKLIITVYSISIFLGSTYGTFRRELEKEVITLIPFTCFDTYRGHLEKVRIAFKSIRWCADDLRELVETTLFEQDPPYLG